MLLKYFSKFYQIGNGIKILRFYGSHEAVAAMLISRPQIKSPKILELGFLPAVCDPPGFFLVVYGEFC